MDGTFATSVRSQVDVAHRMLRSATRAGKTYEEAESLALGTVFLPPVGPPVECCVWRGAG